MTIAVFHKMHILTLVFGTSLIGSCIDYSLHFFVHWASNEKLNSGREVREHLLPGLIMAIVSSGLCFAILVFAPFNLLKQMGVFSLFGLISSFLTTIAIFPYISIPQGERKIKLLAIVRPVKNKKMQKIVGRAVIVALFVFSIGSIAIFHKNFKIENNVTKLYTLEGRLLSDEAEANQIIQYSPSGWFIVHGDTAEQALQNEETLRTRLEELHEIISAEREKTDGAEQFIRLVKRFSEITELTDEIVATFIQRVEVHEPVKVNGKRQNEITVFYNFICEMP